MKNNKILIVRRRLNNIIFNVCRYFQERYRAMMYKFRHRREAQQTTNSIYLVYTMGKVASMSVLDAITSRLPHIPVFAMHYLSEKNLKFQEWQLGDSTHWDNRLYRKIHTNHARKIRKCIAKYPHRQIKIVTLVREPLNQIISQIFQQLNLHDLDALKQMTADNRQINFDYPTEWCNDELLAFSGIDVLQEPFCTEKSYEIYQNGRFSVLAIRFEDVNRIFAEAMSAFSGVDGWILGEKNKAENKQYANEYKTFKNELEIEAAVLEKVYSSGFVKHFYTDNEIENFKKQWKIFKKNQHVFKETSHVKSEDRHSIFGHKPLTIWLTGLSGSGKSTIAKTIEKQLIERKINAFILDGDNLRHGLCSDLGFSPEDRSENIRRASEVARMMNDAGVVVIAAFISPFKKDREQAACIIGSTRFREVFIDADIETCKMRDPKGLYAKAIAGEITGFTGIDAPYEKPQKPDIHVNTENQTAMEAAMKIIDLM